jgi:hypothetical protein
MKLRNCFLPVVGATIFFLGGCAADRVIFVTKTTIGIDADTTPPTVSIAYDRTDGYIGPRYDNGAVPPVVSSLQSDLAIFAPKVKQVYATGDAAELVTDHSSTAPTKRKLTGAKKTMFFGTTTTVGLKLSFDGTGAPESISLGYKRKEISVIPLGTVTEKDDAGNSIQVDKYPSVIAGIDMRVNAESFRDTGLALSQFFATGYSAEVLAMDPEIRASFQTIAEQGTSPRVAVILPTDVHSRYISLTNYVRGLAAANDRKTLDSIATTLGVGIDPKNITVERNKVILEIRQRVVDKTSMDQVSTLLQSITNRTF